MSLYLYRAYDAAGQMVSGSFEAGSVAALEQRLRQTGVWLLEARESTAAGTLSGNARLSRGDLTGLFVQLHLLLRSGVNLPIALRRLAEDLNKDRAGPVLAALGESVSQGVSLHRAMKAHPRAFSDQVVAVVQAGEVSGKLPEVFESLAEYFEWMDGLMGEIRQALIYPAMVCAAATALVLGLFTFVVPKFVDLVRGLSMRPPALTRAIMAISATILHAWPLLLGAAILGPLAFRLAWRSPRFASGFDRATMRLPVFGPMITMFALSRFARNLGMLYRSGIPLVRGLEICRDLVGNRALSRALDEVRRGVSEGVPLSRCLGRFDFFPPTLVTMIATGESSGSLDFSLQSLSEYYDQVIPRRIKVVFAIFNPLVMLALIAAVGCVALAVVLPILQLWQLR